MMAALNGRIDEWVQIEPSRWARYVHVKDSPWGAREWSEADGIITLREGLSFADYYAKRAEPETPYVDPIRAELDALKARIDKLEASRIDIRK